VDLYLNRYPLPTPVPRVAVLANQLHTVLLRMRELAATQQAGHSGFRGLADLRRNFADRLLSKMRVLNCIARAMDPVEFPGLADLFRMPRSQSYGAVLTHARVFAARAAEMPEAFLERGLPADFIAQIDALIGEVELAEGGKNSGLQKRIGATAALGVEASRALALRRELDAILTPLLADDAQALAEWKTAQHVQRAARRKPATPPEATTGSFKSSLPTETTALTPTPTDTQDEPPTPSTHQPDPKKASSASRPLTGQTRFPDPHSSS
jgi:hypothetical protein